MINRTPFCAILALICFVLLGCGGDRHHSGVEQPTAGELWGGQYQGSWAGAEERTGTMDMWIGGGDHGGWISGAVDGGVNAASDGMANATLSGFITAEGHIVARATYCVAVPFNVVLDGVAVRTDAGLVADLGVVTVILTRG